MNTDERGAFRRNVIIVAALHVLVLGGLWFFAIWRNHARSANDLSWLDGGGPPVAGADAEASPTPDEMGDDETPTPAPDESATPGPEESVPPSEIVLPAPSPLLAVAPRPTATPIETPRPTPKPRPKPKTSPRPHPRPKPSGSPKRHPHPSPHASPHPSPHKSATPSDEDDSGNVTAKAAFKKATGRASPGEGKAGTANGTGGGNRGGNGHAGGGDTEGDFGWYNAMLHDRFYSRWEQPTSIVTSTSKFSAIVKIRIEKDGTISDVSLDQSSGNDVMDQSVMEAARRVTQVDPLPAGLGDGGAYEVKIDFELSQQSQQ